MERISLLDIIGTYPTTRKSCDELFNKINKSTDDNIIIDFSNVIGITNSFASEYVFNKNKCKKTIIEKNQNNNIISMLDMVNKIKKPDKVESIKIENF
jgi:hypothetical protein